MIGRRYLLASVHDDPTEILEASLTKLIAHEEDSAVILGVVPKLSEDIINSKAASSAKRAEQEALDALNQKLSVLKTHIKCPADIDLASGEMATETINAAILRKAEIVVKLADHSAENSSPALGSVDKRLIRRCPAPTLILRQALRASPKIVVALDNPDNAINPEDAYEMSAEILQRSVDLAERLDVGQITLLHMGWLVGMNYLTGPWSRMTGEEVAETVSAHNEKLSTWLEGVAKRAGAKFAATGIQFATHVATGFGGKALAEAADDLDADILVIGSANRRGLQGLFFGNTAEGVIDHTKSALYVVKPSDFHELI
ncbi:MAG: universal stress protein [Pseudomonadota bacterium]